MNTQIYSRYNRYYRIEQLAKEKTIFDSTCWGIVVARNVSGKSSEQIQKIIDNYEENEIGKYFLQAVRDYEGHFNDKDGLPCLEEATFVCTYRNLVDFTISDKNEMGFKIADFVKEDDVFILNYDFASKYFGCYKVKSDKDIISYLKRDLGKLEKSKDPLVTEDK